MRANPCKTFDAFAFWSFGGPEWVMHNIHTRR